jgi:hypothetical protein
MSAEMEGWQDPEGVLHRRAYGADGAEDYLGAVQAIGDAYHLGMPRQVAISLISAGSAA